MTINKNCRNYKLITIINAWGFAFLHAPVLPVQRKPKRHVFVFRYFNIRFIISFLFPYPYEANQSTLRRLFPYQDRLLLLHLPLYIYLLFCAKRFQILCDNKFAINRTSRFSPLTLRKP